MRHRLLVALGFTAALLLVGSLAFASGTQEGGGDEIITLEFSTFQVGDTPGGRRTNAQIELFEELYGDRYRIEVDEIPGGEEYAEKLTLQISTGRMPDIYISENDTMGKEAYEAGLAIDMTPYLDEIPNFPEYYNQENLQKAINQFGEMVVWDPFLSRVSGVYFNKAHFEEAGIDQPPETWDEFFEAAEALSEIGVDPVGFMTGDNGWTTHFFYLALMASHSEEGLSYATNPQTTEWDSEPFRWATEQLKRIFVNYANEDAIGATYDIIESQMYNGEIAMIGNGPWMASNYSDPNKVSEFSVDDFGYAPLPGNFVYGEGGGDTKGHGAMVAPNGPERELGAVLYWGTELEPSMIELAVTELGWFVPNYDYPEDILDEQPLLSDFQMWRDQRDPIELPWFYDVWTNAVIADGMTRNLDLYVQDAMTLDEYIQAIADFAEAVGEE